MRIAIQTLSEGLREAANHSGGVALCRLRLPLPQSGNRLPRRGSITRSSDPSCAEGCNERAVLAAQNNHVRVRLVQVVVELGQPLRPLCPAWLALGFPIAQGETSLVHACQSLARDTW